MSARELWLRQGAAILRMEFQKGLLTRRGWWIYLLAAGPVGICALHSLVMSHVGHSRHSLPEEMITYAGIFQVFYLRLGIFFGCVGIFGNLIRGELLEKTLHYYFLTPVRREVLALGKYLAGLAVALLCFATSVALSYLLISMHFGAQFRDFLFNGEGLAQLGCYVRTASLACVGYGAVFFLMGLKYRNPMVPAAVVMVWEGINPFLPSFLQKISVIFYLKSLVPVEVPVRGTLALIAVAAEPTPPWMAVAGLLMVSGLILYLAARRARSLEISYSE